MLDDDDYPLTGKTWRPHNNFHVSRVNPATSLIMVGAFDIAGNAFGSSDDSILGNGDLPSFNNGTGMEIDDVSDICSISSFDNDIPSSIDDDLY